MDARTAVLSGHSFGRHTTWATTVQFDTTSGADVTWIDVGGGCHQFFGLGHCPEIDDSLQGPIVGTGSLSGGRAFSKSL